MLLAEVLQSLASRGYGSVLGCLNALQRLLHKSPPVRIGRETTAGFRSREHIIMLSPDSLGDMVMREPLCRALLDAGHSLSVFARAAVVELFRFMDKRIEAIRWAPVFPEDATSKGRCGFSQSIEVEKDSHECRKYSELLRQGFGIELPDYIPCLSRDAEGDTKAAALLERFRLRAKEYCICCPIGAANVDIKGVPDALTREVLKALYRAEGLPSILIGVESERAALEYLQKTLQADCSELAAVHVWIGGPKDIGCLLSLIADAKLYFGADTGPMHMAAALGVPVAAVMGGGTYPRFLPRASRSLVLVNEMECFGCEWACIFPKPACLSSLKASVAVLKVRELLYL